jgi:hypothetical protein
MADLLEISSILIRRPTPALFKTFFGLTVDVAETIFRKIVSRNRDIRGYHFLWALYFLRRYPTFHEMVGLLQRDEKTIRKHIIQILQILDDSLEDVRVSCCLTPIST